MIEVRCTSCGSPDVAARDDGFFECLSCGTKFILESKELQGVERAVALGLRKQRTTKSAGGTEPFDFSKIEKGLKDESSLRSLSWSDLRSYELWLVEEFNNHIRGCTYEQQSKLKRAVGRCHREMVRRSTRATWLYLACAVVMLLLAFFTKGNGIKAVSVCASIVFFVMLILLIRGIGHLKKSLGCYYSYR